MATQHLNKSNNKYHLFPRLCAALFLSQSVFCTTAANALPNSNQIIKYFNPIHEKSYLNEKQDRIIKKKSAKVQVLEGAKPIANRNIGLFALIDLAKINDAAYIERLLANENTNGLSCLLPWRLLESAEANYNWQIIDQLLSACALHNKQLILRVSVCGLDQQIKSSKNKPESDTPDWVFQAGAPSLTYIGADGNKHLMPIYWDGNYLAKWSNFVSQLGKRYDRNKNFQSIGITGGGILGSTKIIPEFSSDKNDYQQLESELKEKFGMTPTQLVGHWKYIADVFPKAFPTQRLNFDINPPINGRKGEDCLDEIADYLIYRYGERIYVTRQNIHNDKRGFEDYRLILKYKNDTLSAYQLDPVLTASETSPYFDKMFKNAFDDGISFAEIPAEFFNSTEQSVKDWLEKMRLYLGYQIILQELTMPSSVKSGQSIPVHFSFVNTGSASPKRLVRELDKGVPCSYKIQLELKDTVTGKTKALLRHTPGVSTVNWLGSKPIVWDEDLKVPLRSGKYHVYLSIIDDQNNRKLNYARQNEETKQMQIGNDLLVGNLEISNK